MRLLPTRWRVPAGLNNIPEGGAGEGPKDLPNGREPAPFLGLGNLKLLVFRLFDSWRNGGCRRGAAGISQQRDVRHVRPPLRAESFRLECASEIRDQCLQRVGTALHARPHDVVVRPVVDVLDEEKYSGTIDKHFHHTVLRIGYSYNGPTEIGGLVLMPDYRLSPERLGTMIWRVTHGSSTRLMWFGGGSRAGLSTEII